MKDDDHWIPRRLDQLSGYVSGMSLRDWFAGQALIGWLSGPLSHNETDDYDDEPVAFLEHQAAVATTCYAYADAMLKAREQ